MVIDEGGVIADGVLAALHGPVALVGIASFYGFFAALSVKSLW